MSIRFSERAGLMRASDIRNKLFDDPDVITLAAGKPDEKLFPVEELFASADSVRRDVGYKALQYSSTEGLPALRKAISDRVRPYCGGVKPEDFVLSSGSQEGIELSAKIFINEGDYVVCESPSYLGALNAFRTYGPRYITIPMDKDGMLMDELESALAGNKDIKMIYTIPDYQNPTGITMSLERRKRLAEFAAKYRVPVIEDSPYADLCYDGERLPLIKSFDKEGWVITLGSFSKILCPGLRLGWVLAGEEILKKYALAKQCSNLQCGSLDEWLTASYMQNHDFDLHINKLKNAYRARRDVMLSCCGEYFPAVVKFTRPTGGFFVWVELPEGTDTGELLLTALKEVKVAFVPGMAFFAQRDRHNFLRLNFSFVSESNIEEGLRRLGTLLHKIV